MKLNTDQLSAVKHFNGPMLVVAGPGSGKTRVLVERTRYLIEEYKVNPGNILVITFSKKAAIEMQQRFFHSCNSNYSVSFGTFHSIFFQIINKHTKTKDSLLSIKEKEELLKFASYKYKPDMTENNEWISGTLELISAYKNIGNDIFYKPPGCFMDECERDIFHNVYKTYIELCEDENKIDFDDMILKCFNLLQNNEAILDYYQNKYNYVLIDEFQDINQSQYNIVKLLVNKSNNIFCVGDDDQSIYGFRGAYPNIMQTFLNDFSDADVVNLSINYRSKSNIISLANQIISDNKTRINKTGEPYFEGGLIEYIPLSTRVEEENEIIKILKNIDSEHLHSTAIIVRTNNEVMAYSGLLKKQGIDIFEYVYEENRILSSFIFGDVLSFLKFVYESKSRENFIGFMNKPNKKIRRMCLINSEVKADDIIKFYENDKPVQNEIIQFFNKLKIASKMKKADLAISFFRKSIGYDKYLNTVSSSLENYKDNTEILDNIVYLFKDYDFKVSLDEFSELIKKSFKSNNIVIKDGVRVMTMHGSKGLEFTNVLLPDVNEGIIPPKNISDESIEEERRLFYVAVTRAKDNLYIFTTKERNRDISRFIKGKL